MGVIYMKIPDDLDQQITGLASDEKVKKTDLLRDLLEEGLTYRATKEDLALVEKERDVLKERVRDLEKLAKNTIEAVAKPVMEDVEKSRVMSCPEPKCGFKTTNPAEYLEHRLPTLAATSADQISNRLEAKIDSKITEKLMSPEHLNLVWQHIDPKVMQKISKTEERLKTTTRVLKDFYVYYLEETGHTAKADLEKLDAVLRQ